MIDRRVATEHLLQIQQRSGRPLAKYVAHEAAVSVLIQGHDLHTATRQILQVPARLLGPRLLTVLRGVDAVQPYLDTPVSTENPQRVTIQNPVDAAGLGIRARQPVSPVPGEPVLQKPGGTGSATEKQRISPAAGPLSRPATTGG